MLSLWAQDEMATAELEDKRWNERRTRILSDLGSRSTASIPAACGGPAEMTAAYRFFDNDKVTWEKILEPHSERTGQRLRSGANRRSGNRSGRRSIARRHRRLRLALRSWYACSPNGAATISLEQVPRMFAFNGLPGIDELIEEELGLFRGREIGVPTSADDPMDDGDPTDPERNYPLFVGAARPCAVYNRLRPNAVDGTNSVAYRANYGSSNNGAASMNFPQGHGDAYGYYFTATKSYLNVFGARVETEPKSGEPVTLVPADFSHRFIGSQAIPDGSAGCGGADCDTVVDDVPGTHHVGFKSVRNMPAAMAARARTVNRIVDLTSRADYVEPREDVLHRPLAIPLTDPVSDRAWGMADCARRGAVGAYLDWAVLNHLGPPPTPGQPDGVESVHRERVDEIGILASAVDDRQERVDAAGAGLNPLGLMPNVVPFRVINPGDLLDFFSDGGDIGKSHYGIVRDFALETIKNAREILRRANAAESRLRDNSEVAEDSRVQIGDSEFGLRNRRIEIFGLPSPSDTSDNDFENNDPVPGHGPADDVIKAATTPTVDAAPRSPPRPAPAPRSSSPVRTTTRTATWTFTITPSCRTTL